ncbi:hypothetical protein K32_23980 [Kaistia sp. 32K]|uniref:phage tail assembly protein n=1 Tax=Kaistia sp. 32K TaxID=2795690 RepID=UPI0019167B4C|nr:phage tail assembly protein [Kaistia sp. 32K]BCP53781.1 hypothetical protein K32_23980 [Kaistia sp. 32K]
MAGETSQTVKLSRPVPLQDGSSITELVFREPRVIDIAKAGNPVKVDVSYDPPKIEFDDAKMLAMAALLSGQAATIIGAVRAEDWTSISWTIAGFFFGSTAAST